MTLLSAKLNVDTYFIAPVCGYFDCRVTGRGWSISRTQKFVRSRLHRSAHARRAARRNDVTARQQTVDPIDPTIVGDAFTKRGRELQSLSLSVAHADSPHRNRDHGLTGRIFN